MLTASRGGWKDGLVSGRISLCDSGLYVLGALLLDRTDGCRGRLGVLVWKAAQVYDADKANDAKQLSFLKPLIIT
jgi:hypothetical protein